MAVYRRFPKQDWERTLDNEHPRASAAIQFIWEYKSLFIWIAASLVLLAALVWGNSYYTGRKNAVAQKMYDAVDGKSGAERFKAYEDIVRKYPRADVSNIIRLEMGKKAFEAGNYDKAINWYEPLIGLPDKKAFLRITALHGIGASYEMKKDYKRAVETYQKAVADRANAVKSLSLYSLARVYEKTGEPDKAEQFYTQILSDSENSSIKTYAEGRLIWLKRSK